MVFKVCKPITLPILMTEQNKFHHLVQREILYNICQFQLKRSNLAFFDDSVDTLYFFITAKAVNITNTAPPLVIYRVYPLTLSSCSPSAFCAIT